METNPNSVIRALENHQSQSSNEFSFQKEDCFYLVTSSTCNHSNSRDYLQAMHPRTRAVGLVPAHKFETIKTTSLNPNRINPTNPSKTFLAYVTENTYRMQAGDLEACKGDPIIILEDVSKSFYFAKLIGKVGAPGHISKRHVELKEDIVMSHPKVLRNNSVGDLTRPERARSLSRRNDSEPDIPESCPDFSCWGELDSGLCLESSDVYEETMCDSSLVLDTVPISRIKIIRGVMFEGRPTIELSVLFCDNSSRIILRDSVAFRKLQINLLESFPKPTRQSSINQRTLPVMPQLGRSNANISMNKEISSREVSDFNNYFKDLLEVSSLLPRCRALLDFVASDSMPVTFSKGTRKSSSAHRNQSILPHPRQSTLPEDFLPSSSPPSLSPSSSTLSLSPSSSQIGNAPHIIKVKVKVKDDLIAFRMPAPLLNYSTLVAKLTDRVGHPPNVITYAHSSLPGQYKVTNQKDLDTCLMLTKNKPTFTLI